VAACREILSRASLFAPNLKLFSNTTLTRITKRFCNFIANATASIGGNLNRGSGGRGSKKGNKDGNKSKRFHEMQMTTSAGLFRTIQRQPSEGLRRLEVGRNFTAIDLALGNRQLFHRRALLEVELGQLDVEDARPGGRIIRLDKICWSLMVRQTVEASL